MFKIFFILAIIVSTLPFNNIGMVIIEWLDYNVEISFTFLVIVLLALFILLCFLFRLISIITSLPTSIKSCLNQRKQKEEAKLLEEGFYSLINNDNAGLSVVTKKIEDSAYQNAEHKKLFLLLLVQYFHQSEESEKCEELAQELLKLDTRNVFAIKTITKIRFDKKLYLEALKMAERGMKITNEDEELLKLLFDIHFELKNFSDGIKIIERLKKNNYLNEDEIGSLFSKLYFEEAKQLAVDNSNFKLVKKLLFKAWRAFPNREISSFLLIVMEQETVNEKIEMLKNLIEENPGAIDGYIVLAEFYLEEGIYSEGIENLKKLLKKKDINRELSNLMALLELRNNSSYFDVASWLNKA